MTESDEELWYEADAEPLGESWYKALFDTWYEAPDESWHKALVESWYQALYEEDCLRVMTLLDLYPILLKEGWKSDPSRDVKGSELNDWMLETETKWMGRTALHVGARRGCVELLEQVMQLCNVKVFGKSLGPGEDGKRISEMNAQSAITSRDEETASASSSSSEEEVSGVSDTHKMTDGRRGKNVEISVSLEDLFIAKDGKYELDALAMAVVNGNIEAVLILLKAGRTNSAIAKLYNINGPPPGVAESWAREEEKFKDSEHSLKKKLGEATLSVISEHSVAKDPFLQTCLEAYHNDRDFNFLPREEYLLHFLLKDFEKIPAAVMRRYYSKMVQSRRDERLDGIRKWDWSPLDQPQREKTIIQVLGNIAKKAFSAPTLCSFVWKLQDGQGRPPRHVAGDEGTMERFLNGVFQPAYTVVTHGGKQKEEGEVGDTLRGMMNVRDGGGRTVVHRTAIRGKVPHGTAYSSPWAPLQHRDEYYVNSVFGGRDLHQLGKALLSRSGISFDETLLSIENGFNGLQLRGKQENGGHFKGQSNGDISRPVSLLHSAIIHKRADIMHQILIDSKRFFEPDKPDKQTESDKERFKRFKSEVETAFRENFKIRNLNIESTDENYLSTKSDKSRRSPKWVEVGCLELATLVGDAAMVKIILKAMRGMQSKESNKLQTPRDRTTASNSSKGIIRRIHKRGVSESLSEPMEQTNFSQKNPWPALHLAAGDGRYEILRLLTDQDLLGAKCNLSKKDYQGNSPLHHATKGSEFKFYSHHLLDYINCQHVIDSRENNKKDLEERQARENHIGKYVRERKGCIDLLIQSGCDTYNTNELDQIPHTASDMPSKFVSWWSNKQAKDFGKLQQSYAFASNAISVVAALVATASYVGPLQPPLGYNDNSLQLGIVWVKIFMICDTMSFYTAIAAIVCSFIPAIPMPQKSTLDELKHTQRMVALALLFLSPSIIFVLMAFAASSIAVVDVSFDSGNHGGLTIATYIGGLLCFISIVIFFRRFLKFILYLGRFG